MKVPDLTHDAVVQATNEWKQDKARKMSDERLASLVTKIQRSAREDRHKAVSRIGYVTHRSVEIVCTTEMPLATDESIDNAKNRVLKDVSFIAIDAVLAASFEDFMQRHNLITSVKKRCIETATIIYQILQTEFAKLEE